MESHGRYRLLFVVFSLVLFFHSAPHAHAYRSGLDTPLSPDMAPELQPVSSPGPASIPISNSPNFQPVSSSGPASVPTANSPVSSPGSTYVSTANSPLNYVPSPPSEHLIPKNVNPQVMEICDLTDHPILCLGTVTPFLHDETDSFSILQVSVKATNELAKFALSMAEKFCNMPGVPPQLASVLRDCKDSYDEALYNFEKAMNALPDRDFGTLNTMLSAVITDIGDCEDELSNMGEISPLSNYAEKLTNMTSNCLAIASLCQD